MTRAQLLLALRNAGYTGPTNLLKEDLELLLAQARADQHGNDDLVVKDFYKSINKGDACKIDGVTNEKFVFIKHFRNPAQEYVEVKGIKRGQTRCIAPTKLRTARGKLP